MRYVIIGILALSLTAIFTACDEGGAPGGTCAPQCNEAAQALIDLCGYTEVEAELYFNACTSHELGDDIDACREHEDEADCILEATTCEEAEICQ